MAIIIETIQAKLNPMARRYRWLRADVLPLSDAMITGYIRHRKRIQNVRIRSLGQCKQKWIVKASGHIGKWIVSIIGCDYCHHFCFNALFSRHVSKVQMFRVFEQETWMVLTRVSLRTGECYGISDTYELRFQMSGSESVHLELMTDKASAAYVETTSAWKIFFLSIKKIINAFVWRATSQ